MPSARQLSLLPKTRHLIEHGGLRRKGKRKTARPFHPKYPLHLVLKSARARGVNSMLHPKNHTRVDKQIRKIAAKYRVRLFRYCNAGNHLHLLAQFTDRTTLRNFLRELAGSIAQLITGATKSKPACFWTEPPYSRIITWGKDFTNTHLYVIRNLIETALGLKRDPRLKMYSFGDSLNHPPPC